MAKSGGRKNEGIVECSSGISVIAKPVSIKLLELFELNHRHPDPPMMDAAVVGGGTESIPNPDDVEYQEVLKDFNKKTTDDFLAMILDLGIDVDLPDDGAWIRKLQRIGVAVPDDPDDVRLLYIQTIVMPDFLNDLQAITASVLRQSGVDEEAIASWVALF